MLPSTTGALPTILVADDDDVLSEALVSALLTAVGRLTTGSTDA
jgi:hypothetical protein